MSDDHSQTSSDLDASSRGLKWARTVEEEVQAEAQTLDEECRGKVPRVQLRALTVRLLLANAFGRFETDALARLIRLCKLDDLMLQTDYTGAGTPPESTPPEDEEEEADEKKETHDEIRTRFGFHRGGGAA